MTSSYPGRFRRMNSQPTLNPQRRVNSYRLSRICNLRTDPHARSSARRRKTSQYFSRSHRHDPRSSVALLRGWIRGYATSRGGRVRQAFSGIHADNCSCPPGNDPQHVRAASSPGKNGAGRLGSPGEWRGRQREVACLSGAGCSGIVEHAFRPLPLCH
jgi:hypothetical protein